MSIDPPASPRNVAQCQDFASGSKDIKGETLRMGSSYHKKQPPMLQLFRLSTEVETSEDGCRGDGEFVRRTCKDRLQVASYP